jgi:hypothetical protein
MWWLIASALAWEPAINGGIGAGVVNPGSRLLGVPPGFGATGSVEVTELIEPIPWLGVGMDSVVGFYPAQCDTCTGYPALRQGFGLVFRQRRGLIQAGMRYSVGTISLARQNRFRPYIRSEAVIPAGDLQFRVGFWGEGLPPEIGISLGLGWFLDKGKLRVSRKRRAIPPAPKPAPPPAPTPEPAPEPTPAPEPKPDSPW